MLKVHNFSAGPSILPQEVFKEASQAILSFADTNLSILEVSHRSKEIVKVIEESTSLVTELLGLPDYFKPLFLTGGASTQFYMSALNLLSAEDSAGYINTGTWSQKAINEASAIAKITEVASSKEQKYTFIPKEYELNPNFKYLHITTNNTVYGTQFQKLPNTELPIVADMSSDIFSKPINPEKFALIYAGAQKNMGPAGVTLVIVDERKLGNTRRNIPTMLDYNTHIKKQSSFNTPPVFPIYVSMLVMRWIKRNGGVSYFEKYNAKKARLLYDAIDNHEAFYGPVAKEDRSKMNIVFKLYDETREQEFIELAQQSRISGIKGHRSAGGFRASIYNAMPMESVEVLVDVINRFK